MGLHESHGKKAFIDTDTIIWCAIGAVFGWIVGAATGNGSKAVIIENVAVGVFGAFVGAELVTNMLGGAGPVAPGFSVTKMVLAVGGAGLLLALLTLMRKSVGPMKSGKAKPRRS